MDTILLRKLSRKSVLWFGQHEGISVGQLLDQNKINYLRWVYFNIAGISFLDEVLNDLNISCEYRIKKPGVDNEKYKQLSSIWFNGKAKIKSVENLIRKRKIKKDNRLKHMRNSSSYGKDHFCKMILQSKNQGHK